MKYYFTEQLNSELLELFLIESLENKWCHSIYLNDRKFVTYKLFSLGIFA